MNNRYVTQSINLWETKCFRQKSEKPLVYWGLLFPIIWRGNKLQFARKLMVILCHMEPSVFPGRIRQVQFDPGFYECCVWVTLWKQLWIPTWQNVSHPQRKKIFLWKSLENDFHIRRYNNSLTIVCKGKSFSLVTHRKSSCLLKISFWLVKIQLWEQIVIGFWCLLLW